MSSSFQVVHPSALFEREKKKQTESEWKERYIQISSVTESCLILCNPMDCSMPGLPVHHQFPEFTQTHVHWVSDAIQQCRPLLPPSIFPIISVFSNESTLRMRWPKYWSFSLSIIPSKEHPGLISSFTVQMAVVQLKSLEIFSSNF